MREKLLSIGDDYWIENDQGERAYKVDGKAFRVRKTFVLEDTSGAEVARIQERKGPQEASHGAGCVAGDARTTQAMPDSRSS